MASGKFSTRCRAFQKLGSTRVIPICRYYVKKCAKPQKRAALALAVSIGSAVERDDEQGVAHIVEHLAFNATEVRHSCSCIHPNTRLAGVSVLCTIYVGLCSQFDQPQTRAGKRALLFRVHVYDAHCSGACTMFSSQTINVTCLQKYANHDLIKYLESIGAEFGACQNAYTSADDTVYEFMVPTDDDDLQILDRSFDVFAEFATKIRQVQRALLLELRTFHICRCCLSAVIVCGSHASPTPVTPCSGSHGTLVWRHGSHCWWQEQHHYCIVFVIIVALWTLRLSFRFAVLHSLQKWLADDVETAGAQQQIWTMREVRSWRSGARGKIAEGVLLKTSGKWSCKEPRFGPGLPFLA